MANKAIIKILTDNNLKVTPQRTAVLEVIYALNNHPSADYIIDYLRLNFPHIPLSTVYKILDVFVGKGIVSKVKTDDEVMRYDFVKEKHHHLYCAESERIEDYYDKELDKLLENYLKKKTIPNFKIKDIKLQIVGNFTDKSNND
ncbi:MAG: Fur family transcriptional regulator [Bacteroidia bacterium]|jgi:Fur family peroxide stress response transcriptional regulator|nr:Fur family transcriptional regulator [Bacteroidia bacterium]